VLCYRACVIECRVCRLSTAPLYSPCKCRGSIKYVHQDCLTAWLRQRGGIGTSKCELCGHLFEFAPIYAENAPAGVRAHQLVRTLLIVATLL
jgi:E3 ubiquitin-protein ligase MARCH6